ncbi:piggyBac transposable element-derived protein 4-like [Stegodyphus dumicola]|uniref:piggyBac transposable element-derived protein 4-like n=1 Tax=Stegodyphus dumicola TaxID=202533 RepID=UPI0015AEC817|nr:piggyBac transposable element-derived protein 4-like [Stegodyphus dumicola]
MDEQLFPTKTRCRFLQYMPNKPDKFGIKFWLAVDVRTKYLLNGFPYLGKDKMRPSLGENVVNRLVDPYKNSGRNITTDSFFTSVKLAKSLKSKGLSHVGTVNRAKREIPSSFKNVRNEIFSSVVMKHDYITLTSYQSKRNKNVILLSTLHSSVEFESNEKKVTDVIQFYNSTKFGVDVLNQTRKYSVKAPSRRWPVHVFYNILDLAGLNV